MMMFASCIKLCAGLSLRLRLPNLCCWYTKKTTTKKPEYIQMESNKKQNWKLKN